MLKGNNWRNLRKNNTGWNCSKVRQWSTATKVIKSLSKIKLGMVIVSKPGTSLVSLKTSVSPCQEHRRQTALDKVWGRTRRAEAVRGK